MVYVDDGIFLGNDDSKLQDAIHNIQGIGLNIEDQGHPADYVGVNIKKSKDGSYEFTQRTLLNSVITDVGQGCQSQASPCQGISTASCIYG
jgi:hypothetical protein